MSAGAHDRTQKQLCGIRTPACTCTNGLDATGAPRWIQLDHVVGRQHGVVAASPIPFIEYQEQHLLELLHGTTSQ